MFNILFSKTSFIDDWNSKLNALADKYFDNPFSGMLVFIILLAAGCIAIRSFSKR